MGVPVDEVVDWVRREECARSNGVGEGKELRREGLDRLRHPRDVTNQD